MSISKSVPVPVDNVWKGYKKCSSSSNGNSAKKGAKWAVRFL